MTLDEFNLEFDRLAKVFGSVRSEDKAEIYFDRLKQYEWRNFRAVVTNSLDEDSKFPTIAELKQRLQSKETQTTQVKQECLLCDGFGWVSKYGTAYRGSCKHGDVWSEKIMRWPLEENAQRRLLRMQAEDEWKIYRRWPGWAEAEGFIQPQE